MKCGLKPLIVSKCIGAYGQYMQVPVSYPRYLQLIDMNNAIECKLNGSFSPSNSVEYFEIKSRLFQTFFWSHLVAVATLEKRGIITRCIRILMKYHIYHAPSALNYESTYERHLNIFESGTSVKYMALD